MTDGEHDIRRAILATAVALVLASHGAAVRPALRRRLAALCRQARDLADGDLAGVVMEASRVSGVVGAEATVDDPRAEATAEARLRMVMLRYFAGQSDVLADLVERRTGVRCA
jgi:hypothetical protein